MTPLALAGPVLVRTHCALHIAGLTLSAILLVIIALSKSVQREWTVINLLIIFGLVNPVTYIFPYTASGGRPPAGRACQVQAGLVAGANLIAPAAILAVCVQLLVDLISVSRRSVDLLPTGKRAKTCLIVLPWLFYIGGMLSSVLIVHDPEPVIATATNHNNTSASSPEQEPFILATPLYCRIESPSYYKVSHWASASLYTIIIIPSLIIIAALLARRIAHLLRIRRESGTVVRHTASDQVISVALTGTDVAIIIQVSLFTLFVMTSFILSILNAAIRIEIAWAMLNACSGLMMALVFGSQSDTLRVLFLPVRAFRSLLLSRKHGPITTEPGNVNNEPYPAPPPPSPTFTMASSMFPSSTWVHAVTNPIADTPIVRSPTASLGSVLLFNKDGSWRGGPNNVDSGFLGPPPPKRPPIPRGIASPPAEIVTEVAVIPRRPQTPGAIVESEGADPNFGSALLDWDLRRRSALIEFGGGGRSKMAIFELDDYSAHAPRASSASLPVSTTETGNDAASESSSSGLTALQAPAPSLVSRLSVDEHVDGSLSRPRHPRSRPSSGPSAMVRVDDRASLDYLPTTSRSSAVSIRPPPRPATPFGFY